MKKIFRLSRWFKSEPGTFIVLFVIVVLSWLPRLSDPIDLRWDGGVYYILGSSLAQGKGYKLLNEPGEIDAVQYPPLLPLIVAAHQWLLGTSDFLVVGWGLRIFYLCLFMGFTIAGYWLARQYFSPGYALLAACVCALSLLMHVLSDMLYSELPFTLVTTLFVISNRKSERVGYAVLTAVLGGTAYVLRTAGIALLAAWVAESLFQGRLKQMIVRVGVVLVPVLLWQAHVAGVKSSPQYQQPVYAYQRAPYQNWNVTYAENVLLINPFIPELGRLTAGDMLGRIAMNLTTLPIALGQVVSAPIGRQIGPVVLPRWLVATPMLLLACLVLGGMILLVARREWFIPLYFVASVGAISLTPWPEQSVRYLTPLTPFLALSLLSALAFIGKWRMKWLAGRWTQAGSAFGVGVLAMVFFVEGMSLLAVYSKTRYPVRYDDAQGKRGGALLVFYEPSWWALDTSLQWLRQQANPGDVIATTVPHWAYLRTQLKAVLPPMVVDRERAQRLLDSVPVKYVIVDDLDYPGISQRYAAPTVEQHPELWKRVYVAPGEKTRIYERMP